MYNGKIEDNELSGDKINKWGWYKLINEANKSKDIEEIDIITYNYDIFLERILTQNNIEFNIEGIEDKQAKIKIFKPHGSISFCHNNMSDKAGYVIRYKSDMYEANIKDFNVKYEKMDENYYIDAMIPPSGDSSRMTFRWAEDIRELIGKKVESVKNNDKLVISGLSYWHVDRREIDDILVNLPADMDVYMVNPHLPKSLDAVVSCVFDKYCLFTDSKNIGGIL